MGFLDPDLKKPAHDDLIVAFMEVYKQVVPSLFKAYKHTAYDVGKLELEVPVKGDRGYIVGFMDATCDVVVGRPVTDICKAILALNGRFDKYRDKEVVISSLRELRYNVKPEELPVAREDRHWLRLPDSDEYIGMEIGDHHYRFWLSSRCSHTCCFEFKTAIPSVGELLRQLNTYKAHLSGVYVVVVLGECPHPHMIMEQGNHLIEYLMEEDEWIVNRSTSFRKPPQVRIKGERYRTTRDAAEREYHESVG